MQRWDVPCRPERGAYPIAGCATPPEAGEVAPIAQCVAQRGGTIRSDDCGAMATAGADKPRRTLRLVGLCDPRDRQTAPAGWTDLFCDPDRDLYPPRFEQILEGTIILLSPIHKGAVFVLLLVHHIFVEQDDRARHD